MNKINFITYYDTGIYVLFLLFILLFIFLIKIRFLLALVRIESFRVLWF